MNYFIRPQFAGYCLLFSFILTIAFHCFVVLGIVPYEIVWGGRIRNQSEMIGFEAISITVNFILIVLVSIRLGIFKLNFHSTANKIVFWFITVLFGLNTLGNIFSENSLERMLFTPITLIFTLLSLRIAVSNKSDWNASNQ